MIGVQENIVSYHDFYAVCQIQPIKQKLFSFNIDNFKKNKRQQKIKRMVNQTDNKMWMPVMSYKKLYSQPKFIMSLERKKARIISGIRDRQIQEQAKKLIGLVGSKVKNISYRNNINKSFSSFQSNIQSIVQDNQNRVAKSDLKTKKNPHMNFSLMYISQKKKCDTDLKTIMSTNIYRENSSREKGSENPYIHTIFNQSTHKKQLIRPQTANERPRRKQRPKSQIY